MIQQTVASEFYRHPYGGIARDIRVTREGFLRFFEIEEWQTGVLAVIDFTYGKVIDEFHDKIEVVGYRGHVSGVEHFTITFIDRTPSAAFKYVRQETNKVLKSAEKAGELFKCLTVQSTSFNEAIRKL